MHDSSDDDGLSSGVASAGFARLVTAPQVQPEPRKRRRREPGHDSAPPSQPAPIDEQLKRAETCSRSGRIDEAIVTCTARRAERVALGDPERLGWCDVVVLLSHQNAGWANEAVVAGYRAIAELRRPAGGGQPAAARRHRWLAAGATAGVTRSAISRAVPAPGDRTSACRVSRRTGRGRCA